jgi:anti-sigma-K factor RskA
VSLGTSLRDSTLFWRRVTAVLATSALALLVAAIIAREPPDFSATPIVSVVRDGEHHPIWTIRLARSAHQIAADCLRPEQAPVGGVYQLWLLIPDSTGPHPLGLLPQSGRKPIPVTPENARLLAAEGELEVTLEPIGGSRGPGPSGPVLFRGSLEGSG